MTDEDYDPNDPMAVYALAVVDQQDQQNSELLDLMIEGMRRDIADNNGVPPFGGTAIAVNLVEMHVDPIRVVLLFGEAVVRLAQLPDVPKIDVDAMMDR